MHKLKRLLFSGAIIVILLISWLYLHVHSVVRLPAIPYEISIPTGANLKQVSQQLEDAGILLNKWTFILLARYLNQESAIKAGDYRFTENLTQIALLKTLTNGDVIQNEIRFIEGWTFAQIRQVLNEHSAIKNLTAGLTEQEILHLIGASETAAEGLFFPDTYYFVRNSSDIEILQRAYQAMQNNLLNTWSARAASLPLATPYEALILASIIEKETGLESDRAEIAGVFINRLRKGMRLQTDPTIIYGLGQQFDGNLRKKDLLTDQEYNTYTRTGLPPTPIAMPGLASIRAALNPTETDALYFVAKGNGESQFSTNLTDHNKAVAKYQKQQK
ncbi:endolytic transglycosylase MltG [Nitrosomonas supralitoralis]|uniref:Endolytic murein transglycosylase n=1 Tax=Nitrosomonas supralitoralis TaxID=2116706 RepID=A0A2P7NSY6_9PROT|nr:endolytic transglycosylase MltG [Nitrosomonas supralitoralis]PSJ16570.1 endolytic transglycosylase MltG [Nitrosomonas supralitoralis]